MRRNFNRNRIGKAENPKFLCAAFGLFHCRGGYGDFPFPECARHRIVLGNHFHELYRYGSLYALYGSDLHTGTDADPASISWQDHGSTDFHCNVWATDWTGDLWCSI